MSNGDNPFLHGVFAPWRKEETLQKLEVVGRIPTDLQGVLLRNGPNPQFEPLASSHWFDGDGMIHAIRIKEGQASYDNRWVRTDRFLQERAAGRSLPDLDHTTANTNIIMYQNQILALNEGEVPTEMQLSNLDTLGHFTFGGQITRALTAHPRFDHQRKEFLTYSYTDPDGHLLYYRLDYQQRLIAHHKIDWPYTSMIHDFINTEHYVIFPIFPCTLSFERARRGESVFMWEGDQLNTLFIVTDRQGKEVMRIETDPCYVYHFGNAWEQGNCIMIDALVSKIEPLMPDRRGKTASAKEGAARLGRWCINLEKRSIQLEFLDETTGEFPRFDERFNGYGYRHLYMNGQKNSEGLFDRIVHYDLQKEILVVHEFGQDVPTEPVFVPRSPEEGDGYVLAVVYRTQEDRSDVVILDAQQIDAEPLAVIRIPHRIPFGFHGNFISL
ncbi:Lignostilbene-alpha,beta-dioxygenase isozyme I [Legionella massiliensis]|uniref:Lignostilbene-alpha,beta-dioxygenase isozyme I n=1 Tax=Legionella massiliensis TaxID=1034943 RepID=A0A078KZT8_9GAMM|nr:carotenoid oxygenase family protein [Legionella massiliensis]CDZ77318.1 Lignostilbene-alpha,beta-dioxygenase isozyme I [Legionella massiliensis]CEE13056.1 Lignostilbene-alpha,beta-dioxygenase isozyme I [Legionella massiliensis]